MFRKIWESPVAGVLLLGTGLALGLLAAPASAKVDNLGREVKNPNVMVVAGEAPAPYTFQRRDWDLMFTLGATGKNNDSGVDEKALAALGVYFYPGSNFAIGAQVSRPDLANPDVLAFAPVAKLYVFRSPEDSFTKGLRLQPFSWNVATGQNEALSGGAFSVEPTLTAFVEMPLGFGAVNVEMGANYVMTHLSEDPPNTWGALQAGVSFVWWWLR